MIVDLGKPRSPFMRLLFTLYMRYIMPLLGGMVGRRGYRNPWRMLYKTYDQLIVNSELEKRLKILFESSGISEHLFGCSILAMAERAGVTKRE